MPENIRVRAADGFEVDAFLAEPAGTPRGAVVVIQEIFGVNAHIREVTSGFAADGYVAIAPSIFDRVARNIELGYEGADIATGAGIARGKLQLADTMLDLQAAIDRVSPSGLGKVAVVGYCFGGFLTWKCASEATGISCAVGYYGGGIAASVDLTPRVPTMLHFGNKDAHISMADVNSIKKAQAEVVVYVYDADHGFNCDHRASYDEAAAGLARTRTLEFFSRHLQSSARVDDRV